MSIITLSFLSIYRGAGTEDVDRELFKVTVIYSYAFSLIFVGFMQLVVTRYLADQYYDERVDITLQTFMTCAIMLLSLGTFLAWIILYFFEISIIHKYCALTLFLIVTMIWLCMIFLSAIKDYHGLAWAFIGGCMFSIVAAIPLGRYWGTEGYLIGYNIGQALILFWQLSRMLVEFPPSKLWNWEFFEYFKRYWDLAANGLIFNIAIWADKFIFWMAPHSRLIVNHYYTHDYYEAPMFFAYLTIVPTLAMFLMKIETVFYEHYRRYYTKVVQKKCLKRILEEKFLMVSALKESIREIFIIQGTISVLCLIFAPNLIIFIGMNPLQIPTFRIMVVGSFLNVLLASAVVILFYFDQRRLVLAISSIFCITNIIFSYITILLDFKFWGYGYATSCFISLIVAFYLLDRRLKDLEYITFTKQQIVP